MISAGAMAAGGLNSLRVRIEISSQTFGVEALTLSSEAWMARRENAAISVIFRSPATQPGGMRRGPMRIFLRVP